MYLKNKDITWKKYRRGDEDLKTTLPNSSLSHSSQNYFFYDTLLSMETLNIFLNI